MYNQAKRLIRGLATQIFAIIAPLRWKRFNELRYWKKRKRAEGQLSNHHYEYFYTTHFGLKSDYYRNKTIIDIGCGPRGSLEWASMAARRIGLDPLAKEYLRLGASHHGMEYIDAPSEKIPLLDSECDAVFSFNSLDHVEDVDKTIKEIKRITCPGGIFLLLVEVNHPPTVYEPHELTPGSLLKSLRPEFSCENFQIYKPLKSGMYDSILAGVKFPQPEDTREVGYLSAMFIRKHLSGSGS